MAGLARSDAATASLLLTLEGAATALMAWFIFHEGFDAVFTAAGLRIVRSGVRMPRMNSIMERWIGGCRRELLDRTLIWNLPHLRRILAAFERYHNDHRPHMALCSAAPLKPLPAEITDLEAFWVRRRDRAGGVIHEYQHAT